MDVKKRKNRIAKANIALFGILLIVGVLLLFSDQEIVGWIMTILSVAVIIFSVMSLMKRSDDENPHPGE